MLGFPELCYRRMDHNWNIQVATIVAFQFLPQPVFDVTADVLRCKRLLLRRWWCEEDNEVDASHSAVSVEILDIMLIVTKRLANDWIRYRGVKSNACISGR